MRGTGPASTAARPAIVGTGISGLVCAHLLGTRHDLTIFEADTRPGGHTNTVTVDVEGDVHRVDTGFLVTTSATTRAS